MKTLATVLLCVGVLLLQGCTYVPAVEPTNLSLVNEGTAQRSEIEAVLGEPVESRGIDQGSISIYIYDRGAEGGIEASKWSCPSVCGVLIQPFIWASTPFLYADKVDEQEGYLAIVYSADDTVIEYSVFGSAVPD